MDEVDDFLKKYEAHAGLSKHKMYARMPRYHHGRIYDYDPYSATFDLEREPYVEMYVPQHRFQEMVERDRYYTKLSREHDYATTVVNQQVQDEIVRKQNPAVEKAWRRYQMLLELARK